MSITIIIDLAAASGGSWSVIALNSQFKQKYKIEKKKKKKYESKIIVSQPAGLARVVCLDYDMWSSANERKALVSRDRAPSSWRQNTDAANYSRERERGGSE